MCDFPMESSFLLALFGMCGSGIIVILNYFLRSRCTEVSCCGIHCTRSVLSEEAVVEMERGGRTEHIVTDAVVSRT